jgi:N-acetylmuramoyl-L-alanine amidase
VKKRQDLTMACGDGRLYLNPGEPGSVQLVVDGVMEIIRNYNVDGIHFDDYFYPGDMSYDDSGTYEKYGKSSGISIENWRRANTTALIKAVYEAIKAEKPGVEFGVSPSGIWQNKSSSPLGSDTQGFESYNRIFADGRLWVKDEIIDYIVPQIYWPIGRAGADYDIVVRWWRDVADGTSVKLYIGHAAYQVGTSGAWLNPTETGKQIALNRSLGVIGGSVFYGYSKIEENALGLKDQLKELFFDGNLALPLKIAYPMSGSVITARNSYIIGSADPRYPLYLNNEQISRTISGYFSVYVGLDYGENEFVFKHQDEELNYTLNSNWTPPKPAAPGGGTPAKPKINQLDKPLVYITKDDLTVVRAQPDTEAIRLQPLKKGVKGYVTAESNGYYLMDSGNWTYKPNVDIRKNESLPTCRTQSAKLASGAKTVDIAFGLPYFTSYYVEVSEKEIILTLHQTRGQSIMRDGDDPIFGEIIYEQAGQHAVYRLPLKKAGRSYGYHIRYNDTSKILTFSFNKPPALSADWRAVPAKANGGNDALWVKNKPFKGTVIVLDPGHGGRDNGATGPPGSRGQLEKDINLDLALVLSKLLSDAGADVRLTRDKDISMDLEARSDMIREIKPDLAISLHRNSLGADKDISSYFGVLALYTHPQSIALAGSLKDALVIGTPHRDGGSRWQSLAMCRIEECPSVLLELGFISNPADYERMNRQSAINKEARAIVRGLISYMDES